MAPHVVMQGICHKIPVRIPSAFLCWLIAPIQGAILNYYMAIHISKWYWLWSIADVIILATFTVAFLKSFHFLKKTDQEQDREAEKERQKGVITKAELPLGWIAWLIYSVFLAIRMAILFWDVVQHLDEKDFFGPNTLKLTIASAAFVCLLLIATHHDAPYGSSRQSFISGVSKGATMDILDTVAILDILFIIESHIFLTFEMHRTIIFIAFVNLILPTVPLLVLSQTRFGKDDMTTGMKVAHTLIYMMFINVPLFIIRLILWHVRNQNISVFLIKNVLGIVFTIKGVYEIWSASGTDETDHGKRPVGGHEMEQLHSSKVDEIGHVEIEEGEEAGKSIHPPRYSGADDKSDPAFV